MALATAYLRRTGQASPALAERAAKHLKSGVAKLLNYEVGTSGGFSLWGRAPADLHLTAYALMVFQDLAKVETVDPAVLTRIEGYLRKRQQKNGGWKGGFNASAYTAWALAATGRDTQRAMNAVRDALPAQKDTYSVALGTLALVAADPDGPATKQAVARLRTLAVRDDAGVAWSTGAPTLMRARGKSASVETTGLALQALVAAKDASPLVRDGFKKLLSWRQPSGAFGSTQATLQALRALLATMTGEPATGGTVTVADAAGKEIARHTFPKGSLEPARLRFTADGVEVKTTMPGVRATLTRRTWTPWKGTLAPGRLKLAVAYPAKELGVGEPAAITVAVRNTATTPARTVTLEIGVPPGCEVNFRRTEGKSQRVERGERAVVIYLNDLAAGEKRTFKIPVSARYALDVHTAPSKAYEYYTPEEAAVVPPSKLRAR